MNASFCLQGVLIALGAVLLLRAVARHRERLMTGGLSILIVSGAGLFLVGLAPEDSRERLHFIGAAVHLVGGSLALILLGTARYRTSLLGKIALLVGVLGLGALVVLMAPAGTGIGAGTWERIAAYPLPLWLVAQGIARLRSTSPP